MLGTVTTAGLAGAALAGAAPTLNATFAMEHPSFASFNAHVSSSVFITSFAPRGTDHVFAVDNIKDIMNDNAEPAISVITDTQQWPNQASPIAPGTVQGLDETMVLVAGGFLLPPKTTGHVSLFPLDPNSTQPAIQISTDKKGYFFHKAIFRDLNGDGLEDILTARAHKGFFGGKGQGEVLWYEQPVVNATQGQWKEHFLFDGPGVEFDILPTEDLLFFDAIVTAGFFHDQQLAIYYCSTSPHWSDCSDGQDFVIDERVIDADAGQFFNVEVVDLNNDGILDLLATTQNPKGVGSLIAYVGTLGLNFDEKHVLATGFKPAKNGPGKGAPGTARALHLNARKPSIILSGDDAGTVTLLTPTSLDPESWEYDVETLCTSPSGGTIGDIAVGDFNSDLKLDIAVPYYSDNKVEIYSF